ncbi:hypothetical protein [Streptomyces sp. NPDC058247]|uniref:hypothetical protein n=1 Tax=Streptomyces sp. NPDC058247 TaxID=3346401 RepID=UPI0036E624B8
MTDPEHDAPAIPEDDWTDRDILTRPEASARLRTEIEAVERERTALPGSAALDAERALLDRRLAALRAALRELGG